MILENGLTKGQYPVRLSQGYTLLFLLLLSSLTFFPRWADGECYLSGIRFLGCFNPVDCTYTPCPSGFLQEQKARKWKREILGRYFMAFRKWGWTFQKNLLTLGRSKCGGQKAWMTVSEVCPCLRVALVTNWSLEERATGQWNVVNMGSRVWSRLLCANLSPVTSCQPPRLALGFTAIKIECAAQSQCLKTVGHLLLPPQHFYSILLEYLTSV